VQTVTKGKSLLTTTTGALPRPTSSSMVLLAKG
jgi:hypothetical protein